MKNWGETKKLWNFQKKENFFPLEKKKQGFEFSKIVQKSEIFTNLEILYFQKIFQNLLKDQKIFAFQNFTSVKLG